MNYEGIEAVVTTLINITSVIPFHYDKSSGRCLVCAFSQLFEYLGYLVQVPLYGFDCSLTQAQGGIGSVGVV